MTLKRVLLRTGARVAFSTGALRALQAVTLPDAVSVVTYHGVTAEPLPVADSCFTSLARFAQQMEYLARHFTMMHLEEALEPGRPATGRPVACVTFDDGFAGVHDFALPVLEKLSIPATVYLVTDLVDSDRTVWFAELNQALTQTSAVHPRHQGEHLPLASAADRAQTSSRLQRLLKALPSDRFTAEYDDVLDRLGFGGECRIALRPEVRILSSEQIRRMSRHGLLRFGGHTSTHQILTRTTKERAALEIERSIEAVAGLVDRPSDSFAYPNGGLDDFDANAVDTLRRLGVRYGVTTMPGPNGAQTDPYRIHRYTVGAREPLSRFATLVHNTRAAVRGLPATLGGG